MKNIKPLVISFKKENKSVYMESWTLTLNNKKQKYFWLLKDDNRNSYEIFIEGNSIDKSYNNLVEAKTALVECFINYLDSQNKDNLPSRSD